MKQKFLLCLLPVLFGFLCCSRERSEDIPSAGPSVDEMTVLGEKLVNPYSMSIMREAFDELTRTKSDYSSKGSETLEPNWLYVRFLPKDTTELRTLERLHLDLFDHPLDYEVKFHGNYYHDPSIPEGQITWLYTRIRPDFVVPDRLAYEVIDECFIPDDNVKTRSFDDAFYEELEKLALVRAGIPLEESSETKAGSVDNYPYGTVKVDITGKGEMRPVKGAKVKCNVFLKIASAYTDQNGVYKFTTPFYSKPVYQLEFNNIKNFTIWDGINFLSAADINYGKQPVRNFHIGIPIGVKQFDWAAYNNAGYDYYEACEVRGIPMPPSDLKIMAFDNGKSEQQWGSAPMLRRITGIRVDSNSLFVDIISNIFVIPISTVVMTVFKLASPDILISSGTRFNYQDKYWLAWHEISHSSHYMVAGVGFWQKVASSIMSHGFNYGLKTDDHAGLIDVMESWAFAYTDYTMYKTGESKMLVPKRGHFASGEEFHYYLMIYLMYYDVLLPSQIINCLGSDVDSYETFKKKIISFYPSKKDKIEEIIRNCPK